MNPVFTDPLLQKTFEEQGYVIVDLLQANDVKQLVGLFNKYADQFGKDFHTTHFSTDKEYKQQVNDTITDVVGSKAKKWLNDYRPVFGNFMIKQPASDFFMPLHADWTYVDETRFRSVAIWVPLVDSDEENGCLGVIPGSHRVMNAIRGPRIQQSSYNSDKQWAQQFGRLLPIKAGQAIIYDHALMHYSPPNKSANPRPAINLSLVPTGADVVHYCIPEGAQEIEVYRVDDPAFFIRYDNYQRPEMNTMTGKLPADTVKWIDDKMVHFKVPREKKKNLFARLFGA